MLLQFFIKILGLHCSNSVLNNSDWDKINHSLTKKKKKLQTNSSYPNFGIGQIYTTSKFIKEKIQKTIAEISI